MTELAVLTFFLDIVANAFLSFITAWLLIEGFLAIFRYPSERLKTFFRLVPFIKLPIDLVRYNVGDWAVLQGIDPSTCALGTRAISASLQFFDEWLFGIFPFLSFDIRFHLTDGPNFSLMDFGLSLIASHTMFVKCLFMVFLGVSFCLLTIRIYRLYRGVSLLREVIKKCTPLAWKVGNQKIHLHLQKKRVALLVTNQATVPFAAISYRKNWIVFPQTLLRKLQRDEIEAIIAHELAHILWRDPIWQQGIEGIRSLFFWVPTQWLMKRMQRHREYACDVFAMSLGVNAFALASALTQTAKASLIDGPVLAASWSSRRGFGKRIERLFQAKKKRNFWIGVQTLALLILCMSIAMGKLWIF